MAAVPAGTGEDKLPVEEFGVGCDEANTQRIDSRAQTARNPAPGATTLETELNDRIPNICSGVKQTTANSSPSKVQPPAETECALARRLREAAFGRYHPDGGN